MTKMRWESGRQQSGYEKLQLFQGKNSDAYLLRFPKGSSVPPHRDKVPGRRHFRLNITLRRATGGGEVLGMDPIFQLGPVVLFRPDIDEHWMSRVYAGHCLMLSIGVAL